MLIDPRSFILHDTDESANTSYYGYIHNDREAIAFCIIRETKSGSVKTIRYFYLKDSSVANYDTAWADRANKTFTHLPNSGFKFQDIQ